MKRHFFLYSFYLFLLLPRLAMALDSLDENIQFGMADDHILAIMNCEIPASYHAYSHEPGMVGKPASFKFDLDGLGEMPVIYPDGVLERDIYDPAKEIRAYRGQLSIMAWLPVDSAGEKYSATLDMLLCSATHCLPYSHSFSGQIPENILPLRNPSANIGELLERLKEESATLSLEKGKTPAPVSIPAQGKTGRPDKSTAVLAAPDEYSLSLSPVYAHPSLEIFSLGKAMFFGLLAGLILNAMPCVLPVLALKVNSLLQAGHLGDRERLRLFRNHNIFFAAGILTLFTLLALVLGAADLMWGQLYQNQLILLTLLFLVFLMGLSMLGVFTMPAFNFRLDTGSKNQSLQSYCSGFVCTFLATPCSGPLLGGVLAWAFTQPPLVLLAVFWTVGLGMSLPYLALCIWPDLARILPRPGEWMYVFEHILGFMLLGTTLYLLSIMPENKWLPTLGILLGLSVIIWLWGRFCTLSSPLWLRRGSAAAIIFLLGAAVWWLMQPPDPAPKWAEYEPLEFARSIGKRNMMVEFTANWCPNCKYLEATALTEKTLLPLQKRYDLELIRVDLTNPSPYAEKLLAMLGGKSIPLTALFPRGQNARHPLVIRDIYTASILKDAARNIFQN